MKNPAKSEFQIANPLSPLKFWKKVVIEKVLPFGISTLVVISIIFWAKSVWQDIPDGPETSTFMACAIGVIIAYLVSMVVYTVYVKVYIQNYFYDGGIDFITIKKGVFTPTEIHVQYQKIQDVYVDQDILDRVMGLYDVHIASATVSSGIEAHIDGVDAKTAERLKNFFLQSIKEKSSGHQSPTNQSARSAEEHIPSAPAMLKLNETVSSDTYPISGRWVFASIVQNFFLGFTTTLVIVFFVFFMPSKHSTMTLADRYGWDVSNLTWFIPLMIILFTTLHTAYTLFWKSTFSFQFLPEYIFVRTGIIARQEKHVPYNTIQDVTVSQGIIERLLGIATVKIENAAGAQFVPARKRGTPVFNGVLIPGQPIERAQRITQILKEGGSARTTRQGTGL